VAEKSGRSNLVESKPASLKTKGAASGEEALLDLLVFREGLVDAF
jgi:hypothetical protein